MIRDMKLVDSFNEYLRTHGIGAYEARTIDFLRKGVLFHVHLDTGLSEDDKRKGLRGIVLEAQLPIVEAWHIFSEINSKNYGAEEFCLKMDKRLSGQLKEFGIIVEEAYGADFRVDGRASIESMQKLAEDGFSLLEKREPLEVKSYIWLGDAAGPRESPLKITVHENRLTNTAKAPLGEFVEKLGGIEQAIDSWAERYHSRQKSG